VDINKLDINKVSVTSGFRRDADENCTLPRYNAVSNGNPLPTFQDHVSVPFSRVKKSKTLNDSYVRIKAETGKLLIKNVI
jgi:hypothetical protein